MVNATAFFQPMRRVLALQYPTTLREARGEGERKDKTPRNAIYVESNSRGTEKI
tara:strand:+ start:868 stop:1029 length:162 start_codon:yes stop_codon:yes gene_type:complete